VVKGEEHGKPVFVVWGSPVGTEIAYTDILLQSALPVFRSFANCVTAVKAYFDYHDFATHFRSPFTTIPAEPAPAADRVRPLLQPRSALSEHASKQVIAAYGIPVNDDVLAESATDATKAAAALDTPAVLKVCSPDLLHKSDLGLVRVGVPTAEVARAFEELVAQARAAEPDARIEGVLVSPLVTGGVEVVVGVSTDPLFGPVVMLGLGGVHVEVLGDVTHRVPPFDSAEARRMIDELRGAKLFDGVRGQPAVDKEALVDVLMKVQRLALDLAGTVSELDLNPLVVGPSGAVALDALVVCK
jgi:acyl-CoA synthetase (NDP forming)